ncbi:hypothetical protein [Pseudovibrio ascidiaceicola]|uniref:hypothetical protein n=1 Tax=Pseudovibrio ascidiaceicola TaxID=285279 RepID=UPI00135905FB|nr:hypothetical protein [Pseudovibrio ascidiaceicola]
MKNYLKLFALLGAAIVLSGCVTTRSSLPDLFVEQADDVARANYIDKHCPSMEMKNQDLLAQSALLVCLTSKRANRKCAVKEYVTIYAKRYEHYTKTYKGKTSAQLCKMARDDAEMKGMFQKARKKKAKKKS